MVTNASMTHYHSKLNPETRLDEWIRYTYDNVMFQGGKGSSLNKGYEASNDIKIRIPYSKNTNVNISNFEIGDIVVKGTLDMDITEQSDLKDYDTFNITFIVNNDYGKLDIQHVHIDGK